tara:strand:+ start:249 stop:635 length:387 start_codon:yes stop_codon:yes gene_type:complete
MIKQIHIVHCDEVKLSDELAPEIVNRIETKKISEPPSLREMQHLVDGLIQVYPAQLPKLISLLPTARKCQDMIINEEGRFTKPINKIATNIAYEIFGADKITGKVPDTNQIVLPVHGTCFITDNWRID